MDAVIGQTELTIADLPEPPWPRYELLDGSLHVAPLETVRHQLIVGRLTVRLMDLAPDHLAVLPGVNITPGPNTLLIPDVAVVDAEAAHSDTLGVTPGDVAWAVEVVSPSTARMDRGTKRDTYIEWGIETYWMVDPRKKTTSVTAKCPRPRGRARSTRRHCSPSDASRRVASWLRHAGVEFVTGPGVRRSACVCLTEASLTKGTLP